MSMACSASLKQNMMAAFWFSGLPSPSFTPLLLPLSSSGFAGSCTLHGQRKGTQSFGSSAPALPSSWQQPEPCRADAAGFRV